MPDLDNPYDPLRKSRNTPPAITIESGDVTIEVDVPFEFVAVATDPDGDALAFEWSVDDTLQVGASSYIFVTSFSTIGMHLVMVAVSDGQVSVSDMVTVEVAESAGSTPPVPTGIVAFGPTATTIDVQWDAMILAEGYKVYRSLALTGPYTEIADTPVTNYVDTGLSSGTTYYYKVSAYNSYGESAESPAVSATTL